MSRLTVAAMILPALLAASVTAAPQKPAAKPAGKSAPSFFDPQRAAEIEKMLPPRAQGLGPQISDRAAWEKFGRLEVAKTFISLADKYLKEPLLDQPDDLFLEYTKSGNRRVWEKVAFERRMRFARLVLAECITNQGKYLDKIGQYVEALCAEKTWVLSAHDRKLENYNGKIVDIDLGSSALSWQMATAYWLLGDKMAPATRKLILDNVERRSNNAYRERLAGKVRMCSWWNATHNWNAVCSAGTIGTALATIDDRAERARFVASAEKGAQYFLSGFTPDGYCSEGLGYWNYGFGHYVLLSDTVWQATVGKVDCLANSDAKAPAKFGANIQVINGVCPAFADCPVPPRPGNATMFYLNRRFDLGLTHYAGLSTKFPIGYLFEEMIFRFDNGITKIPASAAAAKSELRTWFDSAGILISRPAPNSTCKLGVALKGGHNAEHHNHNDVGSFVAVVGDKAVVLDPGAEYYTARTFSAHRYDSKLLSSYGHPVPVVAGQLQQPGREAQAKIIRADFSDDTDTLAMDIASAYPVKELKKLTRTFVYSRASDGSLTITDSVEFAAPQSFATALITLGKFNQQPDGSLLVEDGKSALVATIDAGRARFKASSEEIVENAPVKPTRIGIELAEPVTSATITITLKPR